MRKAWEHDSAHDLLIRLIGFSLGPNPELHIEAIRAWRANIVQYFNTCFVRLQGDESALEVGPGFGFTSRALAPRVRQLTCLEVSESFLRYARKECAGIPNISFQHGSYTSLQSIPAGSIDAVVSSAVFIHADMFAFDLFFSEVARILSPRGRVVFDFFDANRLSVSDVLFESHKREYQRDPAGYPELCKWNSGAALSRLATKHGLAGSLFPHGGLGMHIGASHTIFYGTSTRTSHVWRRVATRHRVRAFFREHGAGFLRPPAIS